MVDPSACDDQMIKHVQLSAHLKNSVLAMLPIMPKSV